VAEVIGVRKASKLLCVSADTVRQFRDSGVLTTALLVGREAYFLLSQVLELKQARDSDPRKRKIYQGSGNILS
jgi:hypothetical protein